jgi:hypothetical protein
MAWPAETLSDDTESSLGDSAFEILGDSTVATSEEDEDYREDATDSISSVGVHGPDDVTSVAGTSDDDGDDDDDDDDNDGDDDHSSAGAPPDGAGLFTDDGAEDDVRRSGLTVTSLASTLDSPIVFEEPPHLTAATVAVVHNVCSFSEPETMEISRILRIDNPPARLHATIRQSMSRRLLAIDEPFRILYIGSADVQEDIVSKLAASLALPVLAGSGPATVRRRSSRFNVVPVSSFGDRGTPPEVELINSFGLELVVDECTSAHATQAGSAHDTLSLHLNGNSWCHSKYTAAGWVYEADMPWNLPHLAIFFCSDNDAISVRQTRLYARQFMTRHAIPTIFISRSPLYEKPVDHYTLDPRSLHACLEAGTASSVSQSLSASLVLRRLPIDLASFLAVDARQLNRNLACLTGLDGPSGSPKMSCHPTREEAEKILESRGELARAAQLFARRRRGHGQQALVLLSILIVCALLWTGSGLMSQKFRWTPGTGLQGAASPRTWSNFRLSKTPTVDMVPSVTQSSLSSPVASPATETWRIPSVQLATTQSAVAPESSEDVAKLLVDPSLSAFNYSDHFNIHTIGDSHIILRSPRKLILQKQPLSYTVEVTRHGRAIDVNLTKLLEGVYALRLRREDAWGRLNVTLSTPSKPMLNQTLQADFGRVWLKPSKWRASIEGISGRLHHGFGKTRTKLRPPSEWIKAGPMQSLSQAGLGRGSIAKLHNKALPSVVRQAAAFSHRVRRQHAAMSNEIKSFALEASRLLQQQQQRVSYARMSSNIDGCVNHARALRVRAVKTFTVARARKQAGRILARLRSRDDPSSSQRPSEEPATPNEEKPYPGRQGVRHSWWR